MDPLYGLDYMYGVFIILSKHAAVTAPDRPNAKRFGPQQTLYSSLYVRFLTVILFWGFSFFEKCFLINNGVCRLLLTPPLPAVGLKVAA